MVIERGGEKARADLRGLYLWPVRTEEERWAEAKARARWLLAQEEIAKDNGFIFRSAKEIARWASGLADSTTFAVAAINQVPLKEMSLQEKMGLVRNSLAVGNNDPYRLGPPVKPTEEILEPFYARLKGHPFNQHPKIVQFQPRAPRKPAA